MCSKSLQYKPWAVHKIELSKSEGERAKHTGWGVQQSNSIMRNQSLWMLNELVHTKWPECHLADSNYLTGHSACACLISKLSHVPYIVLLNNPMTFINNNKMTLCLCSNYCQGKKKTTYYMYCCTRKPGEKESFPVTFFPSPVLFPFVNIYFFRQSPFKSAIAHFSINKM